MHEPIVAYRKWKVLDAILFKQQPNITMSHHKTSANQLAFARKPMGALHRTVYV